MCMYIYIYIQREGEREICETAAACERAMNHREF